MFSNGDVSLINNANGHLALIGNMLVNETVQDGIIAPGSAIDYNLNLLYAIVSPRFGDVPYSVVFNISSFVLSSLLRPASIQ